MSFAGKVALITGASKGVGRAAALKLAKGHAKIAFSYDSDVSGADEVVKEIGSERALSVQADSSNVAAITKLVGQTVATFGHIDILLPFDGMLALGRLESTSENSFDRIFAMNVKGPFFLCQVCFAIFRPPLELCTVVSHDVSQQAMAHMRPGSHIVFLSTNITNPRKRRAHIPYLGAMGAMERMISLMSNQLKQKGIIVECATPREILEWVTPARETIWRFVEAPE